MAAGNQDVVVRHAGIDRAFHWITAIVMTVLLVTSLAPLLGLRFAWVTVHWVAGLLLTVIILLHIIRALFWQSPRSMLVRPSDLGELGGGRLPGKYSLAQKLMHLAWALAILVAIVTGIFLMKKAGVPFLQKDPYVFSLEGWGTLTLLHDLAALASVFLILVHVYFGVLPEKRHYLRAMLTGLVSRTALRADHDVARVERGE